MESLKILKEEINQTFESEHDFAKWKLIVAAALGGTALGLDKEGHPHYWLLLFIPFACLFIDHYLCQYQQRILVLARFIRVYSPSEAVNGPDKTLQDYERYVASLRASKPHLFDLGRSANLYASLGLSLVAPGLALATSWPSTSFCSWRFWTGLGVWALGIMLILQLWSGHKQRLDELKRVVDHIS